MDEADFENLMRIQRMTLRSVANESETESKIKLMSIINDLVTDKNKKVHKEAVLIEAQAEGMTEAEVERDFKALKDDHLIIEPEPGFVYRQRSAHRTPGLHLLKVLFVSLCNAHNLFYVFVFVLALAQ